MILGLLELPTPSKKWLGVGKSTRITYAQGTRQVRAGTLQVRAGTGRYAAVRAGTRRHHEPKNQLKI